VDARLYEKSRQNTHREELKVGIAIWIDVATYVESCHILKIEAILTYNMDNHDGKRMRKTLQA
jgi:hypothetical protein